MMKLNTLYTGDNLPILRKIESESIDLIYLDPPFNSNKDYGDFDDRWGNTDIEQIEDMEKELYYILYTAGLIYNKGMQSYLSMMSIRLLEMKRILKDTGSIYLHCDPTASHYLKLAMDSIFGKDNFRNEIVWHYKRFTSRSYSFQKMHDIILCYAKGKQVTCNQLLQPYSNEKYIENTVRGKVNGKLVRLKDDQGNYIQPKNKANGVKMHDVWSDINILSSGAKERTGYPTQKPLKILERIIQASSNEGDVVLDPFCGCATTCVAAERLKRQWIGIDLSAKATEIGNKRIQEYRKGEK